MERLRLEAYRKLASATSDAELDEAVAELTDRYGQPPQPVLNLVAVARFRLLARAYGLTEVSLQGRHIRFAPLELPDSKQLRLKRYYPEAVFKRGGVDRSRCRAPLPDASVGSRCVTSPCWTGAPPAARSPRRPGAGGRGLTVRAGGHRQARGWRKDRCLAVRE